MRQKKLYLDTRDIISIVERGSPFGLAELDGVLCDSHTILVLSVATISELAAPLRETNAKTNVMALLNQLDALPRLFIAEARIQRLELESALTLMRTGQKKPFNIFTERYDKAVPPEGRPPTHALLRYSLAEAVFDTWRADRGALWHLDRVFTEINARINEDRQIDRRPRPSEHYKEVLSRQLSLFKVRADRKEIRKLAKLLRAEPHLCPSYNLTHEILNLLRANTTAQFKKGDLLDLLHVACLPYVDLATLDSGMRTYVVQACGRLNLNLDQRLASTPSEVRKSLLTWRNRGAGAP